MDGGGNIVYSDLGWILDVAHGRTRSRGARVECVDERGGSAEPTYVPRICSCRVSSKRFAREKVQASAFA